MTTTVLTTRVQAQLDALTTSSTPREIGIAAAGVGGLTLDLTNAISSLNAATSATTPSTSIVDLDFLSASSIALGVTSRPAVDQPSIIRSRQSGEVSVSGSGASSPQTMFIPISPVDTGKYLLTKTFDTGPRLIRLSGNNQIEHLWLGDGQANRFGWSLIEYV